MIMEYIFLYVMFAYDNLSVYKKSVELNRLIYRNLKKQGYLPGYIKSQLGRASLSIMLNIAEGSAQFSLRQRKFYLCTSRASAFECASLIDFLFSENEMEETDRNNLKSRADEISRLLFYMIKKIDQEINSEPKRLKNK
jgi:four helix bundle protein